MEKRAESKNKTCFYFLFRVQITSAKPKLRKIEGRTKEKLAFLFISECSNFDEVKVRKNEGRAKKKNVFLSIRVRVTLENSFSYNQPFLPLYPQKCPLLGLITFKKSRFSCLHTLLTLKKIPFFFGHDTNIRTFARKYKYIYKTQFKLTDTLRAPYGF